MDAADERHKALVKVANSLTAIEVIASAAPEGDHETMDLLLKAIVNEAKELRKLCVDVLARYTRTPLS
jgi:hypothetical protein